MPLNSAEKYTCLFSTKLFKTINYFLDFLHKKSKIRKNKAQNKNDITTYVKGARKRKFIDQLFDLGENNHFTDKFVQDEVNTFIVAVIILIFINQLNI